MESKIQRKHSLDGCPTRAEVAMAYFGRFGQRTAIKHFKECVEESESFSNDLLSAGYVKWHSFFIPQQVIIIFNHMGPPDAVYRESTKMI